MLSAPAPIFAPLGWACFHAAARDDQALLARLRATARAPAFIAACLEAASARDIALSEAQIYAAISDARRHWLHRNLPSPPSSDTSSPPPPATDADRAELPPADWFPVHFTPGALASDVARASRPWPTGVPPVGIQNMGVSRETPMPPRAPDAALQASSAVLDWAHFGDLRFADPFFEQSAGAALRSPATLLFRRRCTLDHLETTLGSATPELPPVGFVFHLSRCGSTLLAQVLAASPRHRVLSETPPIDQLLAHDAASDLPRPRRVARLRALINAYARRRFPGERHLFIKWDAWHTLHLDLIREAFPDTPWIYLHRDPVEILVSQRRQRGHQFIPGVMDPAPFGIAPEELVTPDFDTYTARVLGVSAAAAVRALERPDHHGLAVDYRELTSDTILGLLRDHFGLRDHDEAELAAMRAASARNSKNPVLGFQSDGEAKRREADPVLRALAERWLGDSRRRLQGKNDAPTKIRPFGPV